MNLLAIGAHFDDVEIGCGGTLAKLVEQGHDVHMYVATRSGYTSFDNSPVRSSEVAYIEGVEAAKILGATLHTGEFENFHLLFGDALNTEVRRIIDTVRADAVFCPGTWDVHSDHWALARATLHASRHVPRLACYRCNWYTSDRPLRGTLYIDITGYLDRKLAAIRAYESEWERAGKWWAEYFTNQARNDGMIVGVEYAECFEVIRWLWT